MLSNKEIIVPNNLINAALKKKGVKAGIVNAETITNVICSRCGQRKFN